MSYNANQLAKRWKCDKSRVYGWILSGELPATKLSGQPMQRRDFLQLALVPAITLPIRPWPSIKRYHESIEAERKAIEKRFWPHVESHVPWWDSQKHVDLPQPHVWRDGQHLSLCTLAYAEDGWAERIVWMSPVCLARKSGCVVIKFGKITPQGFVDDPDVLQLQRLWREIEGWQQI